MLVVFAPTAFRVYHDIANFKEAGEEIPQWDLNDLPDRLRRMISEISTDIDYLDLTPALILAAKHKSLVFLDDDTHWSSEGHRVIADALAEALTRRSAVYAEQPYQAKVQATKDSILSSEVRSWFAIWTVPSDTGAKGRKSCMDGNPKKPLGAPSHQLLKTVFPVPLEVIEDTLRLKGYWEGQLIHERRNGSKIIVRSRWDLQQNASCSRSVDHDS